MDLEDVAHLMADHEPEIPQRVEDAAEELLLGRVDRPIEQHEEIEIGVEAEMAPSVTADGDDADIR